MGRLMKQGEVATMINMSTAWLERKRCEGGGIPFHKIGRSVRYREDDVLRFIAAGKKGHT